MELIVLNRSRTGVNAALYSTVPLISYCIERNSTVNRRGIRMG